MYPDRVKRECWKLYLQGKSIGEAFKESGLTYQQVKAHYTNFTYGGMKNKSNRDDELLQIRVIEKELFESIKEFHKNPNAELNNKIAQLQGTYCRICF